jgi:hypothetical protein
LDFPSYGARLGNNFAVCTVKQRRFKAYGEKEVEAHVFLSSALGSERISHSANLSPGQAASVHNGYEERWAAGSDWTLI